VVLTVPLIQCVDLTKRFNGEAVVDQVSLSLQSGEILSILGPSGCGKTTTLRLIAGFEGVDEGEIQIRGRVVSSIETQVPPERRNVGMVIQEYALFPHLRVAQNILFGLRDRSGGGANHRLAELLELVSLTGLEHRYPHELSGGQQQRVALARTLAPRPVTVLLDEPFSNLDSTMRADLRLEVENILRESGTAAIFVTHDREEAFAIADRVAVMRQGRVDQIDTPEVLYHNPTTRFVAGISGISNFLSGITRGERVDTEIGQFSWENNGLNFPQGTPVDLLVRLDDFQLVPDPEGKSEVVSREFRGDEVILSASLPSGEILRCRRHHYSTIPIGTRVSMFPTRPTPFVVFRKPSA